MNKRHSKFLTSVEKIKKKYHCLRNNLPQPKQETECYRAPENKNPCVVLLKKTSQRIFGTSDKWLDLYEILEKQNFICPYSGRRLRIGINASVDHIIPKSMKGPNSLSNLQWVDLEINRMKRGHTPIGFLSVIKIIAKYTNLQLD